MQRTGKVCHSQCMRFSVSLPLQTHSHTKFIVPEAHFHAKLIDASPAVIACKTAKLFKFLHSPTQCDCTIVRLQNKGSNEMTVITVKLSPIIQQMATHACIPHA